MLRNSLEDSLYAKLMQLSITSALSTASLIESTVDPFMLKRSAHSHGTMRLQSGEPHCTQQGDVICKMMCLVYLPNQVLYLLACSSPTTRFTKSCTAHW